MSARLIDALATSGRMAELFSDASVLGAMLEFEVALARAEAHLGVIPRSVAQAIAAAAKPENFDISQLAHDTLRAGTPGIPIAKALAAVVHRQDPVAAEFTHWGTTSQDLADTALVLLLKRARTLVLDDLVGLEKSLQSLSEKHKKTVMLGRSLLQAAPPVTFGLKASGWLSAIRRARQRVSEAFDDALVIQFGGASGTLAALGKDGVAVARALADELGLGLPEAPWHTQRDRLAWLVCGCGILTACLGKMARDIALLMQNEISEAAEPGGDGRGGSSTMPHKRNPIACSVTLAAANRVPGLVASFLCAMVQEHERGVGGWQAEWAIVSPVLQSTGVAIESMAEVAQGLTVDEKRMWLNIESTNGAVFAERAMMLLGKKLGRDRARKLVEEAVRNSARQGKRLAEVLQEMPEVTSQLDPSMFEQLEVPEEYLGSAENFREAMISSPRAAKKEP